MIINYPALTIDNIKTRLMVRKEKLAIAESVTSGLLQAAFSTAQDASLFYEGGITAYNIDQKIKHLHINEENAASTNCVSKQTASEMALGVVKLFNSDWGVAVTGYSSPVKESGFTLYAYYSIAFHDKVLSTQKIDMRNQPPENIQAEYVYHILEEFEKLV